MNLKSAVKKIVPPFAQEAMRYSWFVACTYSKGYDVPDAPHLDPASVDFFKQRLSESAVYLEYGSGGSTLWAHKKVKNLTCVESDKRFLAAVSKKLNALIPKPEHVRMIYGNIGPTKAWGVPLFNTPTEARLAQWKNYVEAPWAEYRALQFEPDTIFIDGRFRVACVLNALLNLSGGSACVIMVDDYEGRPYSIIAQFAELVSMQGRMAVFRKKPGFNANACASALAEYQADWR